MLPEEVTKLIGQTICTSVFEVEREPIRRFADAVGDPNPLYWDEEYSKKSRYGGIIAPPGFVSVPWFARHERKWGPGGPGGGPNAEIRDALVKVGYERGLDGGIEFEFFQPVRVGDTISSIMVIKDIIEREGRTGKLVFAITETTCTNQKGQLVSKARATSIHLRS